MTEENAQDEPLKEINSYLLAIAGGLGTTLEQIENSNLSELEKVKEGIRAVSAFLVANNSNITTTFVNQAGLLYADGRNVTLIREFSFRIEQGAASLLNTLDDIDQVFVDDAIQTASRLKSIGRLGGLAATLLGVVLKNIEGDTENQWGQSRLIFNMRMQSLVTCIEAGVLAC